GESVPGRNVRSELAERARGLEGPGEARRGARYEERRPKSSPRRGARVTSRRGRKAADLELKAGEGAEDEDPGASDEHERDGHAEVGAKPGHELRDLRRRSKRGGLGEVIALRVLPRP